MKRVVCFYIPEPLASGYKTHNEFHKYRMKWKFISDSFYHMLNKQKRKKTSVLSSFTTDFTAEKAPPSGRYLWRHFCRFNISIWIEVHFFCVDEKCFKLHKIYTWPKSLFSQPIQKSVLQSINKSLRQARIQWLAPLVSCLLQKIFFFFVRERMTRNTFTHLKMSILL